MSLVSKQWQLVPIHHVILPWLRAERTTNLRNRLLLPEAVWKLAVDPLLDKADLNDPEENLARLRFIYVMRNVFFTEIPVDTEWFEVLNLTDQEIPELRAVKHQDWTDPQGQDSNELEKVAVRKQIDAIAPPSVWEAPIPFGHDRSGPFTIMEGNKRLTGYVRSGQKGIDIPVFVGISKLKCLWHFGDNVTSPLAYELWKGV
jgi:hypothetical protein